MREPVLILSDLHLGHPASRIHDVELMRPLFEGMGTVVFNGDTFQELATAFRPRSEELLGALKSLCEAMGIDAVFQSGNHDPGWKDEGWLELAQGRIVVTHGDAVMWGGSPWSRESFECSEQIRELWSKHEGADFDPGKRIALAREMAVLAKPVANALSWRRIHRVMDAFASPQRLLELPRVWWEQAKLADEFLSRYFPKAEVLVLGHFHRQGVWWRHRHLILNTGACIGFHRARWVSYEKGWLKTGKVVEENQRFMRGPTGEVWRFEGLEEA